jgi:hypothetical protein
MLLICPARGKLLRRAGQYLVACVRMSCIGRQKTCSFGLLALAEWMMQQPFLDAKILKKKRKCKKKAFYLCVRLFFRTFATKF